MNKGHPKGGPCSCDFYRTGFAARYPAYIGSKSD